MVCRIKKVTEEMLIVMVRCKSTSSYSCHIVCMLVRASAGQETPSGVIPQVESAFFFFETGELELFRLSKLAGTSSKNMSTPTSPVQGSQGCVSMLCFFIYLFI